MLVLFYLLPLCGCVVGFLFGCFGFVMLWFVCWFVCGGFLRLILDYVPGILPCLKGTGVRLCIFQNTNKTAVKLVDVVYDGLEKSRFLL